jgi:hypothetical protein
MLHGPRYWTERCLNVDWDRMAKTLCFHHDRVFGPYGVRSVKEECLSKLILFGEASLRRALTQFQEHYHSERNHQGKGNVLLFPHSEELPKSRGPSIECSERLGGLLKYYHRRAA